MKLFLRYGADVDAKTGIGNAAVHFAARNGCVECMRSILDVGAKVNVVSASGFAPLHFAADIGNPEIVDMLVAAGGNLLALSSDGDTPHQVAKKSIAYVTLHTSEIHAKHAYERLVSHTKAAALAVLREAAQTASSRYKSRSDVRFAALLIHEDGEALFDQKLLDNAGCTLTARELREVVAAWNVSAALNAIEPLLAPQLRLKSEALPPVLQILVAAFAMAVIATLRVMFLSPNNRRGRRPARRAPVNMRAWLSSAIDAALPHMQAAWQQYRRIRTAAQSPSPIDAPPPVAQELKTAPKRGKEDAKRAAKQRRTESSKKKKAADDEARAAGQAQASQPMPPPQTHETEVITPPPPGPAIEARAQAQSDLLPAVGQSAGTRSGSTPPQRPPRYRPHSASAFPAAASIDQMRSGDDSAGGAIPPPPAVMEPSLPPAPAPPPAPPPPPPTPAPTLMLPPLTPPPLQPSPPAAKEHEPSMCCVVCMDAPLQGMFTPCRHICTCLPCGRRLMQAGSAARCPICASIANGFTNVFFAGA
jgi:hypothetical protein